ncbi:MAG: hypothetical protein A2289_17645 [Deltaproteobacteria bacterium RIFOXYA12_FULL_58_15]|nr:MAG: hypothetical protein A2289_17645 [Deltaproteobacteria bacterium RIFOXYA12_FULL_58_15]OGR12761.1 MAG: hypothetical protein A2341_21750 [Deltaproteobacteria bacterium RIFOXYB12_FULL_58_9]
MVTITHRIHEDLKRELDEFCEEHGLKQQAVVQEALAAWLEDSRDAGLIEERRDGPWVDWNDVRNDL